ncbi:MAG: patatin family protein [Syntrophomonadaceae bacterium]|nr:patatin family protein [Syntrophomonadaceae bacterium]
MVNKDPVVALVLGAGSARGLAHIGILQVLEKYKIPINFMVGCSMGAMVAGIYASGTNLNLLEKMVENMNLNLLFDIRVPHMGFISGKRIESFLDLLTKKKRFEDLPNPLYIVATDLLSGDQVILEEGKITDAIRASISIPGIFRPITREGKVLVDGAVRQRLPIEVARMKGADIVIAVDVTFGQGKQVNIRNTLDVILASLDIMQKSQFDSSGALADIIIQPAVSNFSPKDFNKAAELIELGRIAALDRLDEIKGIINDFSNRSKT